MDLICNDIHMDMVKCRASAQMTLEGDINLSENHPDLSRIIFQKASIDVEDIKLTDDHVQAVGKLQLSILYATEDEDEKLASLNGSLPFDESFFLEGAAPGDNADIKWHIEDVSVGVINSRKISVRSIVTAGLQIDCIYSEAAGVDLSDPAGVEFRTKQMEITQLSVCKKDLCRLHQEITLPQALPNIYRMIWSSTDLSNPDFRPMDGKLQVTGELVLFILYENAQEDDNISYHETTLPFSCEVDCAGSREMMVPDIGWEIASRELEIKPDFDGEERMLSIDLCVNLSIKLYEENRISLLSDVYGITSRIQTQSKMGQFRKLLLKNNGKCRLKETIALDEKEQIFQIIHSEGQVSLEDQAVTKEGVEISGVVSVRCLYVTSDDRMPYTSVTKELPFTYLLEAKNIAEDAVCNISLQLAQLSMVMTDSGHIEAGITVDVSGFFMERFPQSLISEVTQSPLDKAAWKALPAMAVYVVCPGDTLWEIGKKYYMPVARLMELNDLKEEEIKPGQKLIVLKEKG